MPSRFDPSVVELPPKRKPDYNDEKFMNPDQDIFVTHEQAVKIAKAGFDPGLFIVRATIPKKVEDYKIEDEPGEFRYQAEWSNGFRNSVAQMGTIFDTKGLRTGLKLLYDEMRRDGFDVDWWVYDTVK